MKRLMIYTKKRNFDVLRFTSKLKSNSNIILLHSLFLCGLIIGSVLSATSKEIFNITENIFTDNKLIDIFVKTFLYSVIIIIASFSSGFCSIGGSFILLLPALNGLVIGVICGSLLFTFGLKGLFLFILMQLPVGTVISIMIIISTSISLNMSTALASYVFWGNRSEIKIKEYIISHILLIPLCVATALAAMVFHMLFGSFLYQ